MNFVDQNFPWMLLFTEIKVEVKLRFLKDIEIQNELRLVDFLKRYHNSNKSNDSGIFLNLIYPNAKLNGVNCIFVRNEPTYLR